MTPKELFDAGKLSAAVDKLIAEVKAAPGDVKLRTSLFEMMAFTGDYDRAEKQLDVIGVQSAQEALAVTTYRDILDSERTRRKVMTQGEAPAFPSDTPPWTSHYVEALAKLSAGDTAGASAALDLGETERPAVKGKADGQAFSAIRDGDDILAPFFEIHARE